MKTLFLTIVTFFLGVQMSTAAVNDKSYKAVFENSTKDPKSWDSLLNNVENLKKAFPKGIEIEVVSHGDGLGLLLGSEKAHAARLMEISAKGVSFRACENTMERQHVTKDQLISIAKPVDSGVAELIRRQHDGWSYIKSGI